MSELKPTRQDAIRLGVEAGFMLSSAHRSDVSPGVTPDHPVPVSDSHTLLRFAELVLAEFGQASQWVPVEERLPEPYDNVIVPGGLAYYDGDGKWRTHLERDGQGLPAVIEWPVKVWQPLPAPPAGEEE